jgi:hypothetical protein
MPWRQSGPGSSSSMTKRCCVERLAALLYTEDDIEVVGEAGTWPMPWSGSPPSARPSSSSTSSLPDGNGVALFRDLHAVAPTAG